VEVKSDTPLGPVQGFLAVGDPRSIRQTCLYIQCTSTDQLLRARGGHAMERPAVPIIHKSIRISDLCEVLRIRHGM
jgi:hypothetical protein